MREGVITTTIAQAGATGNQEGLSNLQRFEAHLPLTLKGGGDPVVTGHCSRLVGKDAGASNRREES